LSWERAICSVCKANTRMRALIYMLSMEVLGKAVPLPEFPVLKNRRGLGMTDDASYAALLADKFDYTNTFYHCEPFFDVTETHPGLYGTYDFIISSDVFEHIAPPVERAMEEVLKLLKPQGALILSVPSSIDEETIEHYPDLHQYTVAQLNGNSIVVNRKKDGSFQVHENPVFHGGNGTTLEMRLFSRKDLAKKLRNAGFSEVIFLDDPAERFGIAFEGPWTHPLIARPPRSNTVDFGQLPPAFRVGYESLLQAHQNASAENLRLRDRNDELERKVADLERTISMAAGSKWLRLGRRLGRGPKLN
jgi:SAM-dependent methyltransferase